MNMFEKQFNCREFVNIWDKGSRLNIIWNQSEEKRGNCQDFSDAIHSACECNDITISYDVQKELVTTNDKSQPLQIGIFDILKNLKNDPLLINITTMDLQVLGVLLKQLSQLNFPKVYCVYTEPYRYVLSPKSNHFDLHQSTKQQGSIKGYYWSNPTPGTRPEKWIAFLGFEGGRALQVRDNYDMDDIVAVITLPSYKPSWQNFIIRENLPLLESLQDNSIRYVQADSFVAAYDVLDSLYTTYNNYYLKVSPFGTKINAMGILLYALRHERKMDIVYDNPIEDGSAISEESGNTHIFDITEFLRIEDC